MSGAIAFLAGDGWQSSEGGELARLRLTCFTGRQFMVEGERERERDRKEGPKSGICHRSQSSPAAQLL